MLVEEPAAKFRRRVLKERHRWDEQRAHTISGQEFPAAPRECLRYGVLADGHCRSMFLHPRQHPFGARLHFVVFRLLALRLRPWRVPCDPMELRLKRLKCEEVGLEDVVVAQRGETKTRVVNEVRRLYVIEQREVEAELRSEEHTSELQSPMY